MNVNTKAQKRSELDTWNFVYRVPAEVPYHPFNYRMAAAIFVRVASRNQRVKLVQCKFAELPESFSGVLCNDECKVISNCHMQKVLFETTVPIEYRPPWCSKVLARYLKPVDIPESLLKVPSLLRFASPPLC
ncbi:hypothetical protein AVEN_11096-1 [Araneus ventricosus]|uniref:Uncharacterized protein n=1 Tax=Araneus ventricosus TaxID=182803 RepID=A0A4Y2MH27_ARAVE|nr:hypothetical protein AVEN_11096-1 [Araneus ventricosus]